MMALRTAIVGCGAVAQRLYRKPLQQLERRGLLRVVALIDPVPEHAQAMAAFFPKAKIASDLDEALVSSTAELTLVLSPAHLHCAHTVAALRHGSHVLCEKPMALRADECARMENAAAERRRILAVGMIRRFFPAYSKLRAMIRDGELGRLRSFEYREGHRFEWDVTTPAAFKPRSQGGTGVLFDIGPHAIDHLAWTFGDLDVLSYADDALAGVESNVTMDVAAPECRGEVHLSWNQPQANELRVTGTKAEAVLRIGYFDQLAIKRAGRFEPVAIDASFPVDGESPGRKLLSPRSYPDAVACQIVQVVRAITLGERPAADGGAGRACVSLLESALVLARPIDTPWLDLHQREAFQRLHWRRSA